MSVSSRNSVTRRTSGIGRAERITRTTRTTSTNATGGGRGKAPARITATAEGGLSAGCVRCAVCALSRARSSCCRWRSCCCSSSPPWWRSCCSPGTTASRRPATARRPSPRPSPTRRASARDARTRPHGRAPAAGRAGPQGVRCRLHRRHGHRRDPLHPPQPGPDREEVRRHHRSPRWPARSSPRRSPAPSGRSVQAVVPVKDARRQGRRPGVGRDHDRERERRRRPAAAAPARRRRGARSPWPRRERRWSAGGCGARPTAWARPR